jgi:pimeloyl-ACP methyl ester carboxylesterase
MPVDKINGVHLYWEMHGDEGEPLVLVHGSWGDHHNWDAVVPELAKTFRVVTYDRRGHSLSERLSEQGNTEEDVADLIALVEHLHLTPAHIVGNSFGAAISLKAAARRPDVFRTLVIHEPPLFGLIRDEQFLKNLLPVLNSRIEAVMELIAEKKEEAAAELFVETVALGEGSWQNLPPEAKETFVYNASTFYDENRDPGSLQMDTTGLQAFRKPALLTTGTQSPPFFLQVVETLVQALPQAGRKVFTGAGHVPHMSHPEEFVGVVKNFCLVNAKAAAGKLSV